MVLLYKAISIWLLLLLTAVFCAVIREQVLVPIIGSSSSLPVIGLLLSVLIFLVTYLTIPLFVPLSVTGYFYIGILWFVMTLGFEFLFGLLVLEKAWQKFFRYLISLKVTCLLWH